MRVVIAKKLLSTVGGSEAQARALAEALRGLGHDVGLVGLRPVVRRPGIPPEVYAAPAGDVTVRDGGLTFRFVESRASLIEGLLPLSLVAADRLGPAIVGADVVHCLAREWAMPLERAAREAGAAFVETPLVHPGQPFSGAGRGDVARYRRDDAVIALTEWEAAWYRERGVERAFVTGVGPIIDGSRLPAVEPGLATILFIGRKERYKGYDALRAAAPLVWQERPDARFVIIGQRRFLGPAPLADPRWSELGVVTEERKAGALVQATMLAMPSDHETFGHTYLEAWSAGRPVIAGDIPPLREVVREGIDGLHAANQPRAVADAILALLADPRRASAMGAAGRDRLHEHFTWLQVARRTEHAYRSALRAYDGS